MATGNYGIKRPADVSPNDIDMYVHYAPSRDSNFTNTFTKLNANEFLTSYSKPAMSGAGMGVLEGLYNLTLDPSIFNARGIYTIVLKPREIIKTIIDCGNLAALPEVKGIVLDNSNLNSEAVNGGLVGYRIEYYDQASNSKIRNLFRIVTSSNLAEPVNQQLSNTTQKAIRYSFNDGGSLLFLTLTPSSAPNVKPNAEPFLGQTGQMIAISNTFFNPVTIEIELTEHDFDTIGTGIFGNQTKSIQDGIYTIYDSNDAIYKQYNLFEIKDSFNESLYEVREQRTNVDTSKTFNNITSL
tara:strand:+ start:1021 stop:1911 length:891 start_codon:yes stop_codon:yes gene_type:complete